MPTPRIICLAVLLIWFGVTLCRAADSLPPDALDHLPPHPRLFANAARWEQLRTQIKTDPTSARLYAALIAQADACLPLPVVVYQKEGKRLLGPVREGRDRMVTFAAAFRLTGDTRYRDRAVAEMRVMAGLPNWNPSHFLDTAEASAGLGITYDWLYDELSPADRALCENAVLHNGLQTSFDTTPADLHWVKGGNNWNQVCHGGLTVGALAVADRDPTLARRVVERAAENLHFGAGTYAPDGVYPEGPSYWGFGTYYHVLLLDALHSTLGTTLGLEKFPGFLASVDYYQQMVAPTGRFFDYSDGDEKPGFNGTVFWFARQLHRPDLEASQLALLHRPAVPSDRNVYALPLIWRDPSQDAAPAAVPRMTRWVGRGPVPVAMLRSALDDPKAVCIGFKGGSPASSHGHMDAGSFIMESDGVRWAIDPGKQDYLSLESKGVDLWNSAGGRFDVFRLGPDAHNILRFDGARQQRLANAQFDGVHLDGPDASVTADLSTIDAPKAAQARRGVCLRADRRVVVQDEWTTGPAPVQVSFQWLTRADVTPDAGGATLRQNGQTLHLRVLAPAKFTVIVVDASQPVHPYDEPNPGLKRIEIHTDSPAGEHGRLTVVAEPGSATGAPPDEASIKPLAAW